MMVVIIVRKITKTLIFDVEGNAVVRELVPIIIVDVNIMCSDKKRQDYRAHLSDWTGAIRFTHKQISVM